ncbi:MAG: hypothetical protein RL514_2319 [Verrucomicrobiota bacterium]|jgi:hypothetical protein
MKHFGRSPILSFGSLLLAAAWLFTATAQAATPGAAQVKKVVGTANYTDARGGGPLKEGDILMAGATINTGAASYVDLDMGVNGNALRVEADSTLALNKLEYTKAGETIVNTQLEVKKGQTVANVINKLSKASKYEIKTPAGVAGIRGTVLQVSTSRVLCLIGTVQFTTVNGQLQLVIGGTVYTTGAAGVQKATTVQTTGLAVAATSLTANTQAANTVSAVVKQFTTAIAAEAAAAAGAGGAAQAAADASRAVMAALVTAVQEAANSAPPAIQAAARAAAANLAATSEAVQTTAAANAAAVGTIAGGGTAQQAQQAAQQAANQSTGNTALANSAATGAAPLIAPAIQARTQGGSPTQIIAGGVNTPPPAPPGAPSAPGPAVPVTEAKTFVSPITK